MKRILMILLLISSLAIASSVGGKYILDPNETRVTDVHYNAELHMVVIHIHAKVLWFEIEEIYGLKVKDDTDIDATWRRIIGDQPDVIHLKRVK